MITTGKVGNRTVYFTDNDKEWRDLVSKGYVVYTTTESRLFTDNPTLFDAEVRQTLFDIKVLAPATRVVGVLEN